MLHSPERHAGAVMRHNPSPGMMQHRQKGRQVQRARLGQTATISVTPCQGPGIRTERANTGAKRQGARALNCMGLSQL